LFMRKFISMITDSTDSLPLANTPEVFGLHPNAEINYYSQATREIWNHLIELQPQTGEFFFSAKFLFILLFVARWKVFEFLPPDHKWQLEKRERVKKSFN
jgi:hypothetical protein